MSDADPPELALVQRLQETVIDPMLRTFVGKDDIIDLLGICLVGGENLFMLGPPGTAKSALVNELGRLIDGRTFDYLLTRFTEPSELFGPFDIRRLREGDLVTNTEGMLPEADLIFLDELLNANSAILNSLLLVLNERLFRRGRETRTLPALMVVGASNYLPEDDALKALFDRFLIRVHCDNVGPDELGDVLAAGWNLEQRRPPAAGQITAHQIRAIQALLPRVDITSMRDDYLRLIHQLRSAGIPVSDRRAVKLQRLLAASALVSGRMVALPADLWVLRYIWETHEQQEILQALVADALDRVPVEPREHPRSRAPDLPDPEQLSRELAELGERLRAPDLPLAECAMLKDRLRHAATRIAWVRGMDARESLQQRVDDLWQTIVHQ